MCLGTPQLRKELNEERSRSLALDKKVESLVARCASVRWALADEQHATDELSGMINDLLARFRALDAGARRDSKPPVTSLTPASSAGSVASTVVAASSRTALASSSSSSLSLSSSSSSTTSTTATGRNDPGVVAQDQVMSTPPHSKSNVIDHRCVCVFFFVRLFVEARYFSTATANARTDSATASRTDATTRRSDSTGASALARGQRS